MKSIIKKMLPKSLVASIRHKNVFGEHPNLKNPKTFNEKVLYRMLNPKEIYATLSDKILVRDYIESKVGSKYLIPNLWVGDALTKESYDALPESFVLKANHASGTNLIVNDKSSVPYDKAKEVSDSWLKMNFAKSHNELHYGMIKPRLLAEKLLAREDGGIPYDFKVHCFNANNESKAFIQVDYNRFDGHKRDIFDEHWNLSPFTLAYKNNATHYDRPACLEEMIELSRKIAVDFGYVRVDWYIVDGSLYFGEVTFTHGCAVELFTPSKHDLEWGSYWDISRDK